MLHLLAKASSDLPEGDLFLETDYFCWEQHQRSLLVEEQKTTKFRKSIKLPLSGNRVGGRWIELKPSDSSKYLSSLTAFTL